MTISAYFQSEFSEHHTTSQQTVASLEPQFVALVTACIDCIRAGGKIMLFGNGGSAADAQHLSTELTIRYTKNRKAIAAIALTTDSSTLTAAANDLSFEEIFSRQIEALGRPGDIALAITTSGKSANILTALRVARSMGITTAAFAGKGGGDLPGNAEHLLVVPSNTTARVQEMHILLGHMLCGALERELGFV